VNRVAGLEAHDGVPAPFGKGALGVLGREDVGRNGVDVSRERLGRDRAGDDARALAVERGDARMLALGRAVDLLRLAVEVALEDLLDRDRAERGALVA